MEGMGNKYPCSTGRAVEEYVIKDRVANMSIESREGILDVVFSYFVQSRYDEIV